MKKLLIMLLAALTMAGCINNRNDTYEAPTLTLKEQKEINDRLVGVWKHGRSNENFTILYSFSDDFMFTETYFNELSSNPKPQIEQQYKYSLKPGHESKDADGNVIHTILFYLQDVSLDGGDGILYSMVFVYLDDTEFHIYKDLTDFIDRKLTKFYKVE